MQKVKFIGVIYYHPSSDKLPTSQIPDGKFPPDTIRIEAIADLSSEMIYHGTRHAAGYFLWRDYINEQGGICMSQKGPDDCVNSSGIR